MKFDRRLSAEIRPGRNVANLVQWKLVDCTIKRSDGSVVFEQKGVEVPQQWSQTAADMLAQKYFRKRGVQTMFNSVFEPAVPEWLRRSAPLDSDQPTVGETSALQVFHRMAGCWTYHGWKNGYFSSEEDAQIFYDECFLALAWQYGAPNSPQWFNTGLHWAYGIEGPASGQWVVNYKVGEQTGEPYVVETTNSYEYPQPHACFIQPVKDSLVTPGGITDLLAKEALLFKYGSGTGTNFSTLRGDGEPLEGGGRSSGMMSFLKVLDVNAGSIKSGGTTRRAAKMVICDMDHPEIEDFISWKVVEEQKAAAMYVGSQVLRDYYMGNGDPENDPMVDVPPAIIDRMNQGFEPEIFGCGFEEPAINTVGGQNSNNSVRITNDFLRKVDQDEPWDLWPRLAKKVGVGAPTKTLPSRELWLKLCRAAWASADPGVQYHDTINEWHTCPAGGPINASNPCAEYLFLDDTACNLASLNLARFLLSDDGSVDLGLYRHIVRIFQVLLDISVQMASFPSKEIAAGTYRYRTTGLGPMNLAGFLMRQAIPYDSDEGRAMAAAMMALMTGTAYQTSIEMAKELGPFPGWEANAANMKRVMRNHARSLTNGTLEGVTQNSYRANLAGTDRSGAIAGQAHAVWLDVLHSYDAGFRNAQATVCAPTGTISFVADCDVTGIEPEFALVKYKKLAGGGGVWIENPAVEAGLFKLGYSEAFVDSALKWVLQEVELEGGGKAPRGTIHDHPGLDENHVSVFAVAVDAAEGENVLRPMAHVLMVAALQPFVSGGISKTVNLPNGASIEDVNQAYRAAHRLGVKSVALYRYGCKLSQPLNVSKRKTEALVQILKFAGVQDKEQLDRLHSALNYPKPITVQVLNNDLDRGTREFLPWRREGGYTQKAKIGPEGHSVFWRTGNFPDGRCGELFINVAKEGSTLRAAMECIAIASSDALQHGTPLESLVDKFVHTKFEPAGLVEGHERIKTASSIMDLIFRDLAITYLGRDDLADTTLATAVGDPTKIVALSRPAMTAVLGLPRNGVVTGELCPSCNGLVVRTGSCQKCTNCEWEGGCG